MRALNLVTLALVIFGGLNLGLAGAARFDLIVALFGHATPAAAVVQSLIGLAALWQLVSLVQSASEGRNRTSVRTGPHLT